MLDIFFPEILAIDQFDGEPEAAMPGMIVRLKNTQAMPARRRQRMKKRLWLAGVGVFPQRQLARGIDERDRLAQVMLKPHGRRLRS